MAGVDLVFNVSKGAVTEKIRDGANLQLLLCKSAGLEADATLRDHDTLAALLGGTTDEADFTNYARKSITNGSITVIIDDTNDRVDIDIPDQSFANAGGAANNTLGKLVVVEDAGGADATRIPLTAHSFDATTDGNELVAVIPAAGFYRAS